MVMIKIDYKLYIQRHENHLLILHVVATNGVNSLLGYSSVEILSMIVAKLNQKS